MEIEVKKIPYLDLKAINEPYEKEIKDSHPIPILIRNTLVGNNY